MVRFVTGLLIVLTYIVLSAQTRLPFVELDFIPTVTVGDNSFSHMCLSFRDKIGRESSTGVLTFKPKFMPWDDESKAGTTWVLTKSNDATDIEIPQSELPEKLQRLKGGNALAVVVASCSTRENRYGNPQNVVIVTATKADAKALEKLLR